MRLDACHLAEPHSSCSRRLCLSHKAKMRTSLTVSALLFALGVSAQNSTITGTKYLFIL
jgi:hypothetical protein